MHSMKNESLITPASPSALKAWILAARPKTLIASISPVLIGASLAPVFRFDLFCLCLAFSLFIQMGANFANDYFDCLKGADTSERIGPARAAQSGWISLPAFKRGLYAIFSLAALTSLPLLIRGGLWGIFIVALSILFAIWYTAGRRPLGYLGLGELLVFCFYGPIATLCTYYILTLHVSLLVFYASLSPGLLCCSILIANNLRDEEQDRAAGKRTLIVRFGKTFGKFEYTGTVLLALSLPFFLGIALKPAFWWAFFSLLVLAFLGPIKRAFTAKNHRNLIPLLPATAGLLALYTLIWSLCCQI